MLNRIRKSFQATMNLIVVNMDQWLRTPRTIVMLAAALVICFVEVSKINRVFMAYNYSLNTSESVFVLAYEGFNILLCCMFFFITINEMPRRIGFQYYMQLRTNKIKWLNSQVYYSLSTVLAYVCFLVAAAFVMSLCFVPWGMQWEAMKDITKADMFSWISSDLIGAFSPFQAIAFSMLPIVLLLITISLFLLLMNLMGAGRIGVLLISFCIFAEYISVQNSLPFSITQYSSLYSLSVEGNLRSVFAKMSAIYVMLDIVLYILMRRTVSCVDFDFRKVSQY